MVYFSQSVWTSLVCETQRETLVTSVTGKKLEDLGLELEMLKEPHEMLSVWPLVLDAHNYWWCSENHQCLGPSQTQKLRILGGL